MKNNEKGLIDSQIGILLVFFVTSVLFSAIVISWFLLNIYGVQVSGIALPLMQGGSYENFIDTSGSTDVIQIGCWTYLAGTGQTALADNSYLLFNNVASNNDYKYTNEYDIENPLQKDYSVVLEYTSNRVLEVVVKNDGFHIPRNDGLENILGVDRYFYPYPNANQLTTVNIKTNYNPTNYNIPILIFTFNNQELFTIQSMAGAQTGILQIYYGGVGAKYSGLTVKSFKSTNDRTSSDWSTFFTMASAYLSAIIKILVWNVDSQYLPVELNILFIKSQLFAIGTCLLIIIRG